MYLDSSVFLIFWICFSTKKNCWLFICRFEPEKNLLYAVTNNYSSELLIVLDIKHYMTKNFFLENRVFTIYIAGSGLEKILACS